MSVSEPNLVNINRRVRVTLTPAGKVVMHDYMQTLVADFAGHDIDIWDKRIDVDGPTEWHLWELFERLGPKMGMGSRCFIVNNNIELLPATQVPSLWLHAVNECNEAHLALDALGAPTSKSVRRVRGPDGDQDVTIGLAERIRSLRALVTSPDAPAAGGSR